MSRADFLYSEKFELISQVRRAAASVPTSITVGACRYIDKYFRSFLIIALGFAFEVETPLELSINLVFVENEKVEEVRYGVNHI